MEKLLKIKIRKAHPDDVQFIVPMIYSSGPHEFDYIFNVANKTAQSYISFAFPGRSGAQSHSVHMVATLNDEVVGIGAFYSGRDGGRLGLGNIWTALRFYGPQNIMKVAQRAAHIETIIPPAEVDAGFISQLGVKEELRGCGIGTAIIQHQIELARSMGLRKCTLDVAMTNPRAQALYERLGFKVVRENKWNYPDSEIQVPGQRRMELEL
jgi:ribosomal protein S18 acetylase RimI-like enzyme